MQIILIIFLVAISFFTVYLFMLTVLGLCYNRLRKTSGHYSQINKPRKNKFAILIPSHNEENVIEKTIANLLNISYDKEFFQVIVIADNCTDKTSIIASNLGVMVLERENRKLRGKGQALRWSFELLLKSHKSFDAFLVIDADTVVSKDILTVLNSYLNSGYKAIQCADLVVPKPGAWSSEITRVGLYLYNYVRPLGRKMLKFSAGLRGNGMCFKSELLTQVPWQAFSQTEDVEYGLNLVLKEIAVAFAPEAVVYAEMPINPANAETQRARWEIGRFPLIKKYSWRLFKEAFKRRSFMIFDSFIELITPAFVNLFLVTFLILLVTSISTITGWLSASIILIVSIILFALQIFYVLVGLYLSNADINAYKALWNVPKYIIWKLVLYFRLLTKGHTKLWIRTARENGAK